MNKSSKYSCPQPPEELINFLLSGIFPRFKHSFRCCFYRSSYRIKIYALLPIERVLINAKDNLLNPKTGHVEEQIILSVMVMRKTFEALNLNNIDPSDAMKNFVHNMKFKKTTGFDVIEALKFDCV